MKYPPIHSSWLFCLLGFLCFAFLLPGCSEGVPGGETVTGTVTDADGKPVGNVMIVFEGANPATGLARGLVGSDGRYTLEAVPDSYKVFLEPSEEDFGEGGEGEPGAQSFDIPEDYTDPDQTGWIADVTDSGENTFDFKMKK